MRPPHDNQPRHLDQTPPTKRKTKNKTNNNNSCISPPIRWKRSTKGKQAHTRFMRSLRTSWTRPHHKNNIPRENEAKKPTRDRLERNDGKPPPSSCVTPIRGLSRDNAATAHESVACWRQVIAGHERPRHIKKTAPRPSYKKASFHFDFCFPFCFFQFRGARRYTTDRGH